jgi:hypothetical protein
MFLNQRANIFFMTGKLFWIAFMALVLAFGCVGNNPQTSQNSGLPISFSSQFANESIMQNQDGSTSATFNYLPSKLQVNGHVTGYAANVDVGYAKGIEGIPTSDSFFNSANSEVTVLSVQKTTRSIGPYQADIFDANLSAKDPLGETQYHHSKMYWIVKGNTLLYVVAYSTKYADENIPDYIPLMEKDLENSISQARLD